MTDMQVRCFLTLIECGSFSEAARRMKIAQSTFSTHIASLEKGVGHPLIGSNRRRVELTREGEIMHDALKDAYDIILDGMRAADETADTESHHIRLAVMEGRDFRFFYDRYGDVFLKKHPEIQIDIFTCGNRELIEKLEENETDLIIGYEQTMESHKNYAGVCIYESPLYLFAEHSVSTEQMEKMKIVLQKEERSPYFETWFQTYCQNYGKDPEHVIRVSNQVSVYLNVEMRRGIGIVDETSIIFRKPQYQFQIIPGATIRYYLIGKNRYLCQAAKKLMDEVRSACERTGV